MVRTGDLRLTGLGLAICIGLGSAASAQEAGDHLQSCPSGTEAITCEGNRAQFRCDFAKAYRGDYQAQRNVAFCLLDGCGGGVRLNRTLACAWRSVILLGGSSRVDGTDQNNFRLACGGLDQAEAATAKAQAGKLQQAIGRASR